MNHRCWECHKELPEEDKNKTLLCKECEEKIRGDNK